MQTYSTLQAAKQLSITHVSLGRYVKVGKIPPPQMIRVGNRNIYIWTEAEIENVRKLLPKIANGRKTRYQNKKQLAVSTQRSAKAKPKKRKTQKKLTTKTKRAAPGVVAPDAP